MGRHLTIHQAVADFPTSLFPQELLAAYLEAKVVVTTRDEDAWLASMSSTLVYARENRKNGKVATKPKDEMSDKYHKYCWDDDFDKNGRTFW
jgi:hypothetical protein